MTDDPTHRMAVGSAGSDASHDLPEMTSSPSGGSADSSLGDGLLLLLTPSANRVYSGDAPRLNRAELNVMLRAFNLDASVQEVNLAGIPYLHVATSSAQLPNPSSKPQTESAEQGVPGAAAASSDGSNAGDTPAINSEPRETSLVARLLAEASAAYALFDYAGGKLTPRALERSASYPDDIISIQKYQGKTNEQLTHLLMNVTLALAKTPGQLLDGSAHLLDPMCGRGTTLNLALMRGFGASGIDIDKSDFDHYRAFITTWLRTHRLKHDLRVEQVRRSGKTLGRMLEFEVAPTKEAWKSGETQFVTYWSMDTSQADRAIKKTSVDAIIADTPYGVQHGSHGGNLERSPLRLLDRALPAWMTMLRTGGTVGLAYNRHVAAPRDLAELLEGHGLDIVHGCGGAAPGVDEDAFRHRVDASIDRDIIVARKPRA